MKDSANHASAAPFGRIVVCASSAGGIDALADVLGRLPIDFPAPIVLVQHRGTGTPNFLRDVLQRQTRLPVLRARAGERLRPGHVYVASPEQHLVIRPDHTLDYVDGRKIHFLRSSANPLFESASDVYNRGTVAVVLTGYDADGTDGVQSVKARGGMVIAQSPETCEISEMPRSAINSGAVDFVLPVKEIAAALVRIVGTPSATAIV